MVEVWYIYLPEITNSVAHNLVLKNVRVRQGRSETKTDFHFEYVLRLHPGVQLRGDWADPEANNGKVLGTILEVRVGKDSPNYDGSVESWWNDGQAGNALRTTYTSIADRFIEMNAGTGVTKSFHLVSRTRY